MVFYIHGEMDDHGLAEKVEKKAAEIGPEFQRRTSKMLFTIQRTVQDLIPRGQHCQGEGKGGTTKSAIRTEPTSNGGRVYADENLAPWFKYFHDGRGPVKPIKAKALRFCIYGEVIFRKSVGPAAANPVMQKGAQQAGPKIKPDLESMAQWITEL